jgi:OOP family OmpA-OmpF porin
VQEDNKIVFEPGSVEITEAAGEILDRIAEILPDCLHVPMEIGGHTDSQGREEMNLGLSQSRADAVLNGLLARGVLVTNLTARGYGETRPIADNDRRRPRTQPADRVSPAKRGRCPRRHRSAGPADAARAEAFGLRPVQRPDDLGPPADTADDPDEE